VLHEIKNRKEKESKGKKEKKEKVEEKKFSFGAIPLLLVRLCSTSVTSFMSRLASLAYFSLGPE
jgi:hypothetical protein